MKSARRKAPSLMLLANTGWISKRYIQIIYRNRGKTFARTGSNSGPGRFTNEEKAGVGHAEINPVVKERVI